MAIVRRNWRTWLIWLLLSLGAVSMLLPFYWLQWRAFGLFVRVDGLVSDRLTPTDGMPVRVAYISR